MHGYRGKILRINLSDKTWKLEDFFAHSVPTLAHLATGHAVPPVFAYLTPLPEKSFHTKRIILSLQDIIFLIIYIYKQLREIISYTRKGCRHVD